MEDLDPIQLENGELACPNCISPLIEGKSPYYFKKYKVGVFDSLKCEFCGFYVLTEKGFIESSKKISDLGLLEKEVKGIESKLGNLTLDFPKAFLSENISGTIITSEQKKELEPITASTKIKNEGNTVTLLLQPKLKFEKE